MAKEMLFSVVCPTCEARIGVHDSRLVNQLVQCPKCGSIVQLSPSESDIKSSISTQNSEKTSPKVVPPPVSQISQPISKKTDEAGQPPRSPMPVSSSPSIPVPPPASIPVPPPISNPASVASETQMPEPMSPGGFNSNSSAVGKNFSQGLSSLLEKMPFWAPYLVIGIGIIAIILLLVLIFFHGSKQDVNTIRQSVVENSESQDGKPNEETAVSETPKNSEGKSDSKKVADENVAPVDKNKEDELNSKDALIEEGDNSENLTIKDGGAEGSALSNDNLDKTMDAPIENDPAENNNVSVENVENADNNEALSDGGQPEDDLEVDNPNQEDDNIIDLEPDQNASVDNPGVIEDDLLNEENDLNPDDLNNNDLDNNEPKTEEKPSDDNQIKQENSTIPGLNLKLKSISIPELKFSQCIQAIRELGALPIEVNWDSLRRNGISSDDKVSWSGKDVTLKTVLTEVLAQRELMFKINEEEKIVFVPRVSVNARSNQTANSGALSGSAMVKAQYSVSDLVGYSPEKTAELIKSIREFLCPGDWKEVGGTGTISSSGGGSVTIMQSQQNQWIIADFLDRLRLARRLAPLYNRDASLEPMSIRAQSALKRNVGINFQPTASLKTALSEIGQRIGVNILLDEPSLKIAGISALFPISFDARAMSLEETFNRIKDETGLVYLAQTPNSFIVTTSDGAKSIMNVEFYPIADLVKVGLTPTVLMEQIVKFESKSWKSQDAASFGLIDFDSNSDCLVVRQSTSVLSKISDLLTQLRARLQEKE